MGSEGRREQTFVTDQDNAIIYQDPDDNKADMVKNYFMELGRVACAALADCGYKKCPGDIMASNPKWCQPESMWKKIFDSWITEPDTKKLLNSNIFFDFRAGYGESDLTNSLRAHLNKQIQGNDIFLNSITKKIKTKHLFKTHTGCG